MAFQALVVLVGVVVGWLRGGNLWGLAHVRLRWIWALPVAYVAQYFSIYHLKGWPYEIVIVASYLTLICFCILNRMMPGVKWASLGIMANFIVMLANGLRMPAYLPAVQRIAPQLVPLLMNGDVGKSIAMTSHTHLNFLGDIFTIEIGPPTLVSIGDLMFAAGLILFLVHAMTRDGHKAGEKVEAQGS